MKSIKECRICWGDGYNERAAAIRKITHKVPSWQIYVEQKGDIRPFSVP